MPGFRYDPKVCSFRTWMLRLTRWRIIDQLRTDLEGAWQDEWEKAVLAAALERLKVQLTPDQFQMFDLYAPRQMPVAEVARLLGTNLMRVYMTQHRVAKLLKQEVAAIEAEGG